MNGELDRYVKLVYFLGETLGSMFEAALYDTTDPAYPVIAAANIRYDDRERIRAFIAEAVGSQKVRTRGYHANYPIQVDFGKLLKASVLLIPGADGGIAGALSLSVRCDTIMKMQGFMSSMLQFNTDGFDEDEPESAAEERTPPISREPTLDMIAETVDGFGVAPGRTSQDERMEIICDLYDMGVFSLKGAVAKTAEALRISEQSVYRYLTKIKRARD